MRHVSAACVSEGVSGFPSYVPVTSRTDGLTAKSHFSLGSGLYVFFVVVVVFN